MVNGQRDAGHFRDDGAISMHGGGGPVARRRNTRPANSVPPANGVPPFKTTMDLIPINLDDDEDEGDGAHACDEYDGIGFGRPDGRLYDDNDNEAYGDQEYSDEAHHEDDEHDDDQHDDEEHSQDGGSSFLVSDGEPESRLQHGALTDDEDISTGRRVAEHRRHHVDDDDDPEGLKPWAGDMYGWGVGGRVVEDDVWVGWSGVEDEVWVGVLQ